MERLILQKVAKAAIIASCQFKGCEPNRIIPGTHLAGLLEIICRLIHRTSVNLGGVNINIFVLCPTPSIPGTQKYLAG